MKRLFIMRHAKSSWKDSSLSDFDRPLNKRGRRTAPLMGELMVEKGLIPDLILSSSAARAIETYKLVVEAAGFEPEIRHERSIYEAGLNTLVTLVSSLPDDSTNVMMTGHNPGFESLVEFFTGQYRRMPTAALADIEFDTDSWSSLTPQDARIRNFFIPKEILEF